MATKGYSAPEVEQLYTHARTLCQRVGDTPQLFQVLRGTLLFYLVRGQTQPALEIAEQLLQRVERQSDSGPQMLGHYLMGMALFQRGVPQEAVHHFEQAVCLYDRQQHQQLAQLYGIDIGVAARSFLAWPLWYLGYPERALAHGHQALSLAQELNHPFSLVFAHCWLAWLHQLRQEPQAAQEQGNAGATLASQQRFALYAAWSTVTQGWALTQLNHHNEGMAKMQTGVDGAAATGAEALRPYFLALLAEVRGNNGHPEEGLRLLDEAMKVVERTEERFYEAEIYRLKGQLTLETSGWKLEASSSSPQAPSLKPLDPNGVEREAEQCFLKAIAIAREQHAKSLELRAIMNLVRLRQQQVAVDESRHTDPASRSRLEEAHTLLRDIYAWFTEGLETPDLISTRALLHELS
ncbi:MAG: hypothetical protein FJ147_25005 [Deltaproteobacteria bacterium]|nr:hypothetical protein [Deltaproteobacteria bacterium]